MITCNHVIDANARRSGGLCDSGLPCPMAYNVPLKTGLCERCQADYDEDPSSYLEFGDYPQGIANWNALKEEMDALQDPTPAEAWDDIPF